MKKLALSLAMFAVAGAGCTSDYQPKTPRGYKFYTDFSVLGKDKAGEAAKWADTHTQEQSIEMSLCILNSMLKATTDNTRITPCKVKDNCTIEELSLQMREVEYVGFKSCTKEIK